VEIHLLFIVVSVIPTHPVSYTTKGQIYVETLSRLDYPFRSTRRIHLFTLLWLTLLEKIALFCPRLHESESVYGDRQVSTEDWQSSTSWLSPNAKISSPLSPLPSITQKTFAIQQKALKIQGLREYNETNATMDFGIV